MGYEIGDKVIYISPFNKPMIGKVVYNVSNNYLIDLSNNTRASSIKISGAFIPVDNYCMEAPFLCYNLLGDL